MRGIGFASSGAQGLLFGGLQHGFMLFELAIPRTANPRSSRVILAKQPPSGLSAISPDVYAAGAGAGPANAGLDRNTERVTRRKAEPAITQRTPAIQNAGR